MTYFSINIDWNGEFKVKEASAELKHAFLKSLPVMAGYITLGIGFGLVYTSSGFSTLGAILSSILIFAGSMQFVSVNLLLSGASPISMILMTIAVNLRHLFYSISMLDKYRGAGKYKPYMEFALTDETFSIVCDGAPEGLDGPKYYFLLSLFNQCYWITGTIIGATLQSMLDISFAGVDFSMTALFTVTLTGQIMHKERIPSSAMGVMVTLACLLIFGKENFLIPSLAIIGTVLLVTVLIEERKK